MNTRPTVIPADSLPDEHWKPTEADLIAFAAKLIAAVRNTRLREPVEGWHRRADRWSDLHHQYHLHGPAGRAQARGLPAHRPIKEVL